MTITEIKAADHPTRHGHIGPLYWEYRRGYARAPIQMFTLTHLLQYPPRNSRAKFCGPVYMERPEE